MFSELWTTTLEVVRTNQEIAIGLAFAVSVGESIVVLSFFAPSTVLLVAKSGLIGAGQLAFTPIFLAATVGAVVGDLISYALGARLGPRMRKTWPLTKHPQLMDRGQAFFERWGVWSLFACRFIGPLRWLIPMLAGSCTMPLAPFVMASLASAVLWAAVVLVPGSFAVSWMTGGW